MSRGAPLSENRPDIRTLESRKILTLFPGIVLVVGPAPLLVQSIEKVFQ
jgi:hypothetical protein